jgi:hypothetical protein
MQVVPSHLSVVEVSRCQTGLRSDSHERHEMGDLDREAYCELCFGECVFGFVDILCRILKKILLSKPQD